MSHIRIQTRSIQMMKMQHIDFKWRINMASGSLPSSSSSLECTLIRLTHTSDSMQQILSTKHTHKRMMTQWATRNLLSVEFYVFKFRRLCRCMEINRIWNFTYKFTWIRGAFELMSAPLSSTHLLLQTIFKVFWLIVWASRLSTLLVS